MIPQRMVCPYCQKTHFRNAAYRWGEFCSKGHYLQFTAERKRLTEAKIERAAQMYPNQKRAAEAIGISYTHFRRVVKRLDLRSSFPARGGAATWA